MILCILCGYYNNDIYSIYIYIIIIIINRCEIARVVYIVESVDIIYTEVDRYVHIIIIIIL